MARRITFHFIAIGFAACLLICLLLLTLNTVIHVFPYDMLFVAILYYFFLNSIWLAVTVMYILKKELAFTGLILLGIGLVYLLFSVLGWPIILSQVIALAIVSILGTILVIYFFHQAEQREERGIHPQLPKMSVTLYSTMPYLLYGFLYFAFLFVDRVMAWTTNGTYMPYLLWFRGDYELGLDFSLLLLIIPMGLSEVVLSQMMSDIQQNQHRYSGDETEKMNRRFLHYYLRRLVWVAVSAVFSAVGVYLLTYVFFTRYDNDSIGRVLFTDGLSHFVYIWSLAAYVCLSVALVNAVTLFSLSRPDLVLRAILPGLLLNLLLGFLLTRWLDYSYAVFGLLGGSVLFACLSSASVIQVLRKLDYHMYAIS